MTDINDLNQKDIQGYKNLKPIGQGKFSTVYKAENKDNQIVALKKIKIFDMMDPKQREKCLKEVNLMKPIDHPNIIKYLDSFIHNNELIIATEWAEKGDLKKLLKQHQQEDTPFEELKVWEFMNQIASALNYMHERRIMHRDLKPANIFIASDNSLKIGDLGLGREFSSETILAYSKVGTPLYMSPELLHGEGYDMKSDVWSLGCVIYELCEFKSPFRNENEKMSLMDLFTNITKGEFTQINKRYSEELSKIINEMIVIDPQKRVDSAYVCKVSEEMMNNLKKNPRIDCILVNEDIYEKLSLLEYHKYFCVPLNKIPVSKVYFSVDDSIQDKKPAQTPKATSDKFFYFVELCYWIMSLPKFEAKNKIQAANQAKKHCTFDTPDECGNQLLSDLKQWGVRIPDQIKIPHIKRGYGDAVCYILNDLLNRELIRLNFKFETPVIKNDPQDTSHDKITYVEPDLDQYLLQKSNENGKHFKGSDDIDEEEEKANNGENKEDGENQEQKLEGQPNNAEVNNNIVKAINIIKDESLNPEVKQKKGNKGLDEQNLTQEQIYEQNRKIIVSNININDWQQELQRVDKQLKSFQGELKTSPSKNSADYQSYLQTLENCVCAYKIVSHAKKIMQEDRFQKLIESWDTCLEQIKKGENKINQSNLKDIEILKDKFQLKKDLYNQLQDISQRVNEKVQIYDQIQEQTEKLSQQSNQSVDSSFGQNRLTQIKASIEYLKKSNIEMDVKIEILDQQLMKVSKQRYLQKANQADNKEKLDYLDDDLNEIDHAQNQQN